MAGVLSEKETLDHIRGLLTDRKNLPIRIDIYYKPQTYAASEKLRGTIVSLVREMNAEMDAEVRLEQSVWVGKGESPFYLRGGNIYTFYPEPVRRPDGGPDLLPSGPLDPKDLEQHILWRLTKPKNIPLTFRIEHDEPGSQLAKQVADVVQTTAKRVGLLELVKVATVVHPDPTAVNATAWAEWRIPLNDFAGVNLGRVKRMSIGVGGRETTIPPGTGRICIDDILVWKP